MEFVEINAGAIRIGRFDPPYPLKNPDPNLNEHPYSQKDFQAAEFLAKRDSDSGFRAIIEKPFYIGVYEVTQAQWEQVMNHNPARFQSAETGRHPVESVSWNEIQAFIFRLNELDDSRTYRLPTEIEWEYAAFAGEGDDIAWDKIRQRAQLGTKTTKPVGALEPNAWGLYDVLGNVWELTSDFYNEKLFADPVPPKSGKYRVIKGASFTGDVKNATPKTHAAEPANGWDLGFRLVAEAR